MVSVVGERSKDSESQTEGLVECLEGENAGMSSETDGFENPVHRMPKVS